MPQARIGVRNLTYRAAVVGQILGGALIATNIAGSHWRAIFLVNVPVGAAVIGSPRESWRL